MLGLAWATLPDLPTYRIGVIMVGLARYVSNSYTLPPAHLPS